MAKIYLTYRAHSDLAEIKYFSEESWGKKIAEKYIADINSALSRLQENPELLRKKEDFSENLKFYYVNKHFLISDYTEDRIIILGIIHCSMDIPNLLTRLEPMLIQEAKLMHKQLAKLETVH